MSLSVAVLPLVSRVLVAIGWVGFFLFFFTRKKPQEPERVAKRDPASLLGIGLQGVGFGLVWMLQRPFPRAGAPLGAVEITLDLLAPCVSLASAWLGITAVRTLGRQWSYAARVIDQHRLVTEGPYRVVRHPIYAAMLGKLLATSFAFGHWLGLLLGGTAFLAGTWIRIRSEERLLREIFGEEFDLYAGRVPALVPGIPPSSA